MFKQIKLQGNQISLFRKNQTYRLVLQCLPTPELPAFGLELPVNAMIRLIKELRRLHRKDLNLRLVEWEINGYKYTVNPTWPSEKSEKVWISLISIDNSGYEQDYIVSITFDELQTFIDFLENVNEL